jgi:hypothetical protein
MCDYSLRSAIERILADELVQLAMASHGVTETEIQRVLEQAQRAIIGRNGRRSAQCAKSLARMARQCRLGRPQPGGGRPSLAGTSAQFRDPTVHRLLTDPFYLGD